MLEKYKTPLTAIHNDPIDFKLALEYTQRVTGFPLHLIEKDFLCTILLEFLFNQSASPLVFKGGTCLNKIHLGFYRLSEDLDFSIPIPTDATRKAKSDAIGPLKLYFEGLTKTLPFFELSAPLRGANNSTQYLADLTYASAVSSGTGRIKIEIGLREPLLRSLHVGSAETLLHDSFKRQPAVRPLSVGCLSIEESMAEKCRAALCRRAPAIRDFFDIWYAAQQKLLPIENSSFIALVAQKIGIPGNSEPSLSPDRMDALRNQLDTELRPVLLPDSFKMFDLGATIKLLEPLTRSLKQTSHKG